VSDPERLLDLTGRVKHRISVWCFTPLGLGPLPIAIELLKC
jgi:hypothetical protein